MLRSAECQLERTSLKSELRISRNVIANYLGQGWASLMALAFLPVYVQELGMEAYGLVGFFAILQAVLAIFDFGVTPTLVRESARYNSGANTAQQLRDLVRSFEWIGCIAALVLVVIMVAASGHIAQRWINAQGISYSTITQAVAVMGIMLAARLIEGVYRGVLLGLGRQVRFNLLNAGIATVRYVGAVVVLRFGSATVEAFFAWQALISVASLLCLMLGAYASLPRVSQASRFSANGLGLVWQFSAGVSVIGALSISVVNVDKFVVSHALSLDRFGYYALAGVAASTLYTLVVPVTQAFYPRIVAQVVNDDSKGMAASLHLSSQLVATLVGVAAIFLFLFAPEVLYIWSGNLTLVDGTAPILSVLSLVAYANCIGHIGVNMQLARSATRGVAATYAVALVLAMIFLASAVQANGAMGAAYVWLLITTLQSASVLALAFRGTLFGEWRKWLFVDMLMPFIGAFLVAGLAYCYLPSPSSAGRLGLAAFLAVAASGAVIVAMLLAPDLRATFYAYLTKRC